MSHHSNTFWQCLQEAWSPFDFFFKESTIHSNPPVLLRVFVCFDKIKAARKGFFPSEHITRRPLPVSRPVINVCSAVYSLVALNGACHDFKPCLTFLFFSLKKRTNSFYCLNAASKLIFQTVLNDVQHTKSKKLE